MIEGPEGPSGEDEFEMVGFVSLYDTVTDTFTCEYEDQGIQTFSPQQLDQVLLPDEVTSDPNKSIIRDQKCVV